MCIRDRCENDFVVVKFTYTEGKKNECEKMFVGKVVDKMNSKFKISYMRNYLGSQNTFIFPNVEDIEENVSAERIKKVVKPISNFRGRFTFPKF